MDDYSRLYEKSTDPPGGFKKSIASSININFRRIQGLQLVPVCEVACPGTRIHWQKLTTTLLLASSRPKKSSTATLRSCTASYRLHCTDARLLLYDKQMGDTFTGHLPFLDSRRYFLLSVKKDGYFTECLKLSFHCLRSFT